MIFQCQIPLGGLPVNIMLVGNKGFGEIVFVRVSPYTGDIIDHPNVKGAVWAGFGEEGFTFCQTDFADESMTVGDYYKYNTRYDYRNIPLMLKWLQQQKLEQPL